MGDVAAALALIDDFEVNGRFPVAWGLDRGQTLARLRTLVRQPEELNQKALNACGPAVFFRTWFARDPVAAASFSCALLRDGYAAIGALVVAAGDDLRHQSYDNLRTTTDAANPGSMPEVADWMLVSALRDSENSVVDYLGQPNTAGDYIAGVTLPGTVASWLNATNSYSSVSDETNLVFTASQQSLLDARPDAGVDIILLVHTSTIQDLSQVPQGEPPTAPFVVFPNHYIKMYTPFARKLDDAAWLSINCWSWGLTYAGWQGAGRFFGGYYGLIRAAA